MIKWLFCYSNLGYFFVFLCFAGTHFEPQKKENLNEKRLLIEFSFVLGKQMYCSAPNKSIVIIFYSYALLSSFVYK
jgi:hypothetical protein